MSESIWRPCVYGQQWPELFAQLPDDVARYRVSEVLADSRLEGRAHTRDDVSDLIDYALGRITAEEKSERAVKRFRIRRKTSA